MAKSSKNNQILSLAIVGVSIATFVFFFLTFRTVIAGYGELSYFDYFLKNDYAETLDKIMAIVGVCIVAWDVLDNILAFCLPAWNKFGKLRAFLQLITAVVWIGIMIYFLIAIKGIAYGAIVLMVLAVVQGILKLLAAKNEVAK